MFGTGSFLGLEYRDHSAIAISVWVVVVSGCVGVSGMGHIRHRERHTAAVLVDVVFRDRALPATIGDTGTGAGCAGTPYPTDSGIDKRVVVGVFDRDRNCRVPLSSTGRGGASIQVANVLAGKRGGSWRGR